MGESGEGNGYALQYSCLDNPVDRGAWWAAVHGVTQSRTWLKWLSMHVGEGNGNPLQCFCLENPGDTGAWWAAVYGVAQSQIWLKWLSSSSSSMGETVWANSGGEGWGRNTHTHTHTHTHAEWHHDVVRPVMEVTEQRCIRKVNYTSHWEAVMFWVWANFQ